MPLFYLLTCGEFSLFYLDCIVARHVHCTVFDSSWLFEGLVCKRCQELANLDSYV